ncbi:MAG: glycosyltransferase family 2 protein [Acidimicrobiales bacterium]
MSATEPRASVADASSHLLPFVSVIIPMLNERHFIGPCVEGFLAQRYPADRIEILVIDGGSDDGSRDVVGELSAEHPNVRLVDNPRRVAAAAANVGIAEAAGDILCFLSAHGVPDPDYVPTSVRLLQETGAVGVGGRYLHVGTEPRSKAIGLAMASPFGMASPHRSSGERVEVDTISHPTFLRQALVDVGGYDETLLRNEDYELNYRLRAAGGRLVFCPEISSVYRPRGSLGTLRRQFFDYGRWKATVMRRHPTATRPRHLVPPLAVAAVGLAPVVATSPVGRRALALGRRIRPPPRRCGGPRGSDRAGASVPTFVAVFPVMHGSGASACWWGRPEMSGPRSAGRGVGGAAPRDRVRRPRLGGPWPGRAANLAGAGGWSPRASGWPGSCSPPVS